MNIFTIFFSQVLECSKSFSHLPLNSLWTHFELKYHCKNQSTHNHHLQRSSDISIDHNITKQVKTQSHLSIGKETDNLHTGERCWLQKPGYIPLDCYPRKKTWKCVIECHARGPLGNLPLDSFWHVAPWQCFIPPLTLSYTTQKQERWLSGKYISLWASILF